MSNNPQHPTRTQTVLHEDQMPWGWSWERFTVVDAGNGQIALHSAYHNRFAVCLQGDERSRARVRIAVTKYGR